MIVSGVRDNCFQITCCRCWLDLDVNSLVLWVVVGHLLILWLAGLLLAFRALTLGTDKLPPPPKHPDKAKRRR